MTVQLRDYQKQAATALHNGYTKGLHRLGIQQPTGTGKTVVMADISGKVLNSARHSSVDIVLPLDALLDQTIRKLLDAGVDPDDIGVVKGRRHEIGKRCRVISIHSLRNPERLKTMPKPQLTVVDEAHRSVSEIYRRYYEWIEALPGGEAYLAGFTATWMRSDRLGLGDIWEEIVFKRSIAWAVERGYLVKPYPLQLGGDLDMSQVRTAADGDYNEKDLGESVMIDSLRDTVVNAYRTITPGKSIALFAPTQASARFFAEALKEAGIPTAEVFSSTKPGDRKWALHGFETGAVKVLVTCSALAEGWDCLDQATEILTRSGWRGMGAVALGDEVQSLNLVTEQLEWVPVTRYVERPVRAGEKMFTIESQHVNVRTTEGHQFHIKSRSGLSGFQAISGAELANRRAVYSLPIAGESSDVFTGVPLTDDEIRLIAWFMTDGGFNKPSGNYIEISQSKDYHNDIRALLTRLGLDFTERIRQHGKGAYPNSKPYHVFNIPRGNGTKRRSGWGKLAPYLNKDVAEPLHDMTEYQFAVFWDEMLKGDGDRDWLWCDRQTQVDAYTMMAVVRGLSSSYCTRVLKSGQVMFSVSVRPCRWIQSYPPDPRAARMRLETPTEGESVWCVTNRNSTLVTRRSGKIAILGNCPRCDGVFLLRRTKFAGRFIQEVGRALRPWVGKEQAWILDFVGTLDEKDMAAAVDLSKTPEPGEDVNQELEECDECGKYRLLRYVSRIDQNICQECLKLLAIEPEERELTAKKITGVHHIDILERTSARWLETDFGMPFLATSDKSKCGRARLFFMVPLNGGYSVGVTGSTKTFTGGYWLAEGVTPMEAARIGSDAALDDDPTITHKNAAWRQNGRAPTQGQVSYALTLGISVDGMTMAQASDAITIKIASRTLGPVYRSVYTQTSPEAVPIG